MSSRVTLSCTREGIFDGLNDSSLAEKEFVRQVEQAVAHPLAQLGDEVKPMRHQKLLRQGLGKIAFVAKGGWKYGCFLPVWSVLLNFSREPTGRAFFEHIAHVSRLCLSTLKLQVNEMSSDRFELKRRGSRAEEWSGSQRSIAHQQELIGQLLRIARTSLLAQMGQSLS